MEKKKAYKLYTVANEYRCRVNAEEVAFIFGIDATQDIATINEALALQGYIIK